MADPRPIDGNNPYEKLGVDRTLDRSEILAEATKIKNKKKVEVKQHHADGNENKYKKANNELIAIRKAIEKIEDNHPEDGHPEPTDLTLELMTDDPSVQETVEFQVTADGEAESGITVVTERNHKDTTGPNGKVSFSFDSKGKVQLQATGDFHHRPDTTTINISRRAVSLQIAGAPGELEVQEKGRVRVTDNNGNGTESVPIMCGADLIARTDSSGVAEVSFQNPGPKKIEATAKDTNDITYEPDTTTIDISAVTIPLNIQVGGGLETEEDITFRVVDDQGTGVKGVRVSVEDGPTATTNSDGKTELRFRKPGPRKISAEKVIDDNSVKYDGEEVTLEVGKGTSELQIGSTQGEFTQGQDVRLRIVDNNGFGIEDALVTSNQDHSKKTDSDGWVELTLKTGNSLNLHATKDSDRIEYNELDTTFTIDQTRISIRFDGLPQVVSQGETVEVQVLDENDNGIQGAKIHSTRQRSRTWTTDQDGFATIEVMNSGGTEKFTADKPERDFDNVAEQKVLVR